MSSNEFNAAVTYDHLIAFLPAKKKGHNSFELVLKHFFDFK